MPGLFSAFRLLLADTEHHATRSLGLRVSGAEPAALQQALDALVADGHARLAADGFAPAMRAMQLGAMARYVGQSSEIAETLALEEAPAVLAALPEAFALEHERTYGFRAPPEEPVELTSLSLVARGIPGAPRLPASIPPRPSRGTARRPTWFASTGWVETQVIDRADLAAGGRQGPVPGPVIIQEYDATCLVPPGMGVALDGFGNLVLRPAG
jgi:N-methylhydantoinase A